MATTPKTKRAVRIKPKAKGVKRLVAVVSEAVAPTYVVTLQIGDDTYKRSGDDLTEILTGFKLPKVNYRALFTLEHNGKKSALMRNTFQVRRIISNKLPAFFFGKNLLMLLK